MRFLVSFFVFLLMCSCGGYFNSSSSEKERLASDVRSKTSNKLKKEMDLIPLGFGGRMMNQIKMLGLAFQYRHLIDMEEGRKILLQAAQEFLQEINSDKRIRPYLDQYPFEINNVEVVIAVQKTDGSDVDEGELSMIVIRDGILRYEYEGSNPFSFSKTYQETYLEACKILGEMPLEACSQ